MKSYLAEVRRAVDDMVALHRKNLLPIVVLDDGGLVATILHSDDRYKDVLHAVKVVEQTTGGLNLLEKKALSVPVIAAAAARSKKREGPIIGRAVAGKVLQALRRHGRSLEGLKVAVIGYGNVGTATARELELAHADVVVVDDGKGAARRAGKRFPVLEKAKALKWADVVISATGETSLQLEHLRLLKDGAVVISAGSKQLEFDMEGLLAHAKRRELARGNPLVRLPDAEYLLDGRRLTFLGDGWPVNFDGDAEDIPPHEIQLTRTLMFLGAVQAARLNAYRAAPGVQPFDKGMDRWLLGRFAELRKRAPKQPIGDPDRWADVIRDVARVAGI
jgi:S-adenosylhomocysteine hydrolase